MKLAEYLHFYFNLKAYRKTCIIYFPLYNYASFHSFGMSHNIAIKYFKMYQQNL